jgi:hypothetical protein
VASTKYTNALKYIGQTGRTFHARYKEHMQAIRNNKGNSGYSNYIPNKGHTYRTITETMDIIKTEKEGKHLNILEKYRVYKINKNRLHMNDIYLGIYNLTFETLYELSARQ